MWNDVRIISYHYFKSWNPFEHLTLISFCNGWYWYSLLKKKKYIFLEWLKKKKQRRYPISVGVGWNPHIEHFLNSNGLKFPLLVSFHRWKQRHSSSQGRYTHHSQLKPQFPPSTFWSRRFRGLVLNPWALSPPPPQRIPTYPLHPCNSLLKIQHLLVSF